MTECLDFPTCGVCGSKEWSKVYQGNIRHGAKEELYDAVIKECKICRVQRLAESACIKFENYTDLSYRKNLQQQHVRSSYYASHREMLNFNLAILQEFDLLDKKFVDVGCGAGIVLDTVRGLASEVVGIEPNKEFGESLEARGIAWFETASQAFHTHSGKFDFALSSQVIEHVLEPTVFVADVAKLLKPNGIAVISTPNLDDILLKLAFESFAQHFYRTQHRWMFNKKSLVDCITYAGLEILGVRFIHRYGFTNALKWISGNPKDFIAHDVTKDISLDTFWKCWLETNEKSDNIVIICRKPI